MGRRDVQLRRLKVRNIRSYVSAEVEFGPGTTLIAGDVGTGKTSLLYAIEMALFGFAEVDAAYLVRHGAVHAEVELVFEGAGHRYEIQRRFRRLTRRGRDSFEPERSTFAQDGASTQYSATELRQRVIDLLGFPDNPNPRAHSDLWRWAVYVPQERMRDVLSQEPIARLETVRKALGVERYRTAAENARDVAREIRAAADLLKAEAEGLGHWVSEGEALGRELATLDERDAGLRRDLGEARAGLAKAEAWAAECDEEARRIEGDRREKESLEREESESRRTMEELVAGIDRGRQESLRLQELAAALPEREVALARGKAESLARQAERRSLSSRRSALESALRRLAEAAAAVRARRRREEELQSELASRSADLAGAESTLATLDRDPLSREPSPPTARTLAGIDAALAASRALDLDRKVALDRAGAALRELETLLEAGVCPRCRQRVRAAEFEPHRGEAREALAAAERAAGASRDDLARIEEERRSRERFERLHERWIELERRRSEARRGLAQARERSAQVQEQLAATLAELLFEEGRRVALAPSEEEATAIGSQLARVEAELPGIDSRLEQARREREAASQASALLAGQSEARERQERELQALGERIGERRRRIDRLEERLAQQAGADARRDEAREQVRKVRERSERLSVELARCESDAGSARHRLQQAEIGLAKRARLETEAGRLETKARWVDQPFREALLRMESRIFESAQGLFERELSRFFRVLIEDPTLEARTESFSPAVLIEGNWTPPEALSGGERTALALAFRLALSQVVRSMGELRIETMLLDEPTDGFSPEQIVHMGELLRELGLPQVILVSHEPELSSVADRVLEVTKIAGVSRLELRGSEAGPSTPPPPAEAVSGAHSSAPPRRRRRARVVPLPE